MAAILVGFGVTRFWQLCTLPGGMHIDETAMAYSAWSLSEYGVDRYLKSWPIYLMNFSGGQSCLYPYMCVALFKIFGYSLLMVRMPAVIFSFLNLLFGMKIMKKVFPENPYLPYIYGSLVVICPYFIMASRFGLDCNLMLGMSTVFLYFFICAMDSGKWQYYCAAGITGGLVLYTYALSYIIVPIFLALSLIYVIWTKRFVFKNWFIMAVPMGILAAPLILVQLVNMFDLSEKHIWKFTITKMEGYRISEIGAPRWDYFLQTLKSMIAWDDYPYNSVSGLPILYGITNIFCLIGLWNLGNLIIKVCKEKLHDRLMYIVLWFGAVLGIGLMTVTNVNKVNAIFAAELMIAVYGMWKLFGAKSKVVYALRGIAVLVYMVLFFNFATYYYGGQYAAENSPMPYFHTPYEEAYQFIVNSPTLGGKVTHATPNELYLALSAKLSPYEYQGGEWREHFVFGDPEEINDQYNYILEDRFEWLMQILRDSGFTEVDYEGYSLFYKE